MSMDGVLPVSLSSTQFGELLVDISFIINFAFKQYGQNKNIIRKINELCFNMEYLLKEVINYSTNFEGLFLNYFVIMLIFLFFLKDWWIKYKGLQKMLYCTGIILY